MESAPQIMTLVLGSTVVGGILTKLLDMWKDHRAGAIAQRRAEVEKATAAAAAIEERARQDVEKAEAREEAAAADADWWARWSRILEENLAATRIIIVNKLGADLLPPYPSRPTRE